MLARQFPNTQRGQLVEDITPERFGRVDVICGGFPCQDLSVAGKRKGLAGARSGLWGQFHRILAEFSPSGCVIENVPGLFSSNGGRDLLTIIRGLAELGYCVAWAVLDSQYRGVAQRRNRVFIVGSLGNGRCAQVLFEPESVRGDSPPSRETGQGLARDVALCLNSGRDGYNDGSDQTYIPMTAGCLQERDAKGADSDTKPGHLVVAFQSSIGRNGRGQPEAIVPALSGADAGATSDMRPCVAFRTWGNCGPFERGDKTAALNTATDPCQNIVAGPMMVRRLTPRECERLQGFPDDWTRWDATGKGISDSARYRMLGNAVTVPVARWLGQQLIRFAL